MQLDPRLKPWHHPASTDSKPLLLRQALCLTRHTFWSVSRLASSSRDSGYASSIKTLSKDFAGRPEFCLSCFGSLNTNLLAGCSGWRWQYTTSRTQSSFTFWTIHIALFFGKIAAIDHLPLRAAILVSNAPSLAWEWVSNLLRGRETVWAINAGAHTLDTCVSKLAARNGKV